MYISRTNRPNPGHKIVLWVTAVAFFIIALDGFVESGRLASLVGEDTQLAKALENWGKHHGDENSSEIAAQYVMIPIDHDNPSGGTYSNRYWVNDQFYRPGGPVFVYDVGEGDAASSIERFLQRPSSFVVELLQEFHGVGIVWEHRYYGESKPFPINVNTPAHDYRFLALNQSLADLPYFARSFRLQSHPGADLTPASTPWVMMGCSYSGTRSALSRLVHPETFFAAYAGSPVVEFTPGIDGYFEAIYMDMIDHGYVRCTRDFHAIMEYVDGQLDDPETAVSIKQQYFGPGAESNSNEDFVDALMSVYDYHKSWGLAEGKPSLAETCDFLKRDPATAELPNKFDLPTSRWGQLMSERLASFQPLLDHVNKRFETNCSKSGESVAHTCKFTSWRLRDNSLAWNYQQCSELGYVVHQNPSSHRLVSKYWSIKRQASMCQKWYPTTTELIVPELTQRVRTANAQFGGWDMRPSNVFWTTGQYDEYRSASPLARVKVDFGGNVSVTQDIPECNVSTGPESIFGLVLPEAVHCTAIAKNTSLALETRRTFAKALHKWLECF